MNDFKVEENNEIIQGTATASMKNEPVCSASVPGTKPIYNTPMNEMDPPMINDSFGVTNL